MMSSGRPILLATSMANELPGLPIESEATEVAKLNKEKADKPIKEHSLENTRIEKGDSVRLNGQNAVGVVLEMQGKQAIIAFGSLKSTVASERLTLVSKKR